MESASASGAVVPPVSEPDPDPMGILTAAIALRWSRPDLTAALADHAMEAASALSDRDPWLLAAGWRVYAAGAVGDGREVAADVLEALPRWGADALSRSTADRLRTELAVLAHDAGEPAAARALLDGISGDGRSGDTELAADLATVRLRCRGDADPADALTAWERLGGAAGQVGAAATLLVAAVTDRRTDRAERAVTRAVDGLGRLDRARPSADALSPSPHLAAALAAEWISSLIATGRPDQAREGSRPLRERLVEHARPTRQLALLRLTLAVAAADDGPGRGADAVRDLERAAHDAAVSDAPELERICRTTLGEVHEAGGRPDAARESVRLAVVAERRHRSRAVRFLAALAATTGPGYGNQGAGVRTSPAEPDAHGRTGSGTAGAAAPSRGEPSGAGAQPGAMRRHAAGGRATAGSAGMADRTAILRAVQTASMADAGSVDRPAPDAADRDDAGSGPPEAGDGSRHRSGDRPGDPDVATDRSSDDRPGVTGSDPHAPGRHGDGSRGAGRNGGVSNGGVLTGTGLNGAGLNGAGLNGAGPDDGEPHGCGLDGPGLRGSGPRGEGGGASGPERPGTDGLSGGARPADVPAVDPWATGAWTSVPDTAPPSETTVPPPAPDPVLSALADPEAWLASALADLDRIWGRRSDDPDGAARGEGGPDTPEADEPPSGCVVVLDLARAGDRLPADDAAPTVRRVARRLAQRLPESAHLRRDSPDTLSVLLADDDRAAAAEWMHRVVPALVDGLAVDAVVEGAHLRAAVHDAQGVVGAQVLQRLDGGRGRSPQGAPSGRARHAAPGAATPDDRASDGPEPGGPESRSPRPRLRHAAHSRPGSGDRLGDERLARDAPRLLCPGHDRPGRPRRRPLAGACRPGVGNRRGGAARRGRGASPVSARRRGRATRHRGAPAPARPRSGAGGADPGGSAVDRGAGARRPPRRGPRGLPRHLTHRRPVTVASPDRGSRRCRVGIGWPRHRSPHGTHRDPGAACDHRRTGDEARPRTDRAAGALRPPRPRPGAALRRPPAAAARGGPVARRAGRAPRGR